MDYPLSSLVTQPSSPSQRSFAEAVIQAVRPPSDASCLEVTDDGLRIAGITEFDLEEMFDLVHRAFPGVKRGKPEVAYFMDHQLHEPYYVAIVVVPEERAEAVIGDLGARRGLIQSVGPSAEGISIEADLPVSESFGYFTVLRSLTSGRGRLSMKLGTPRPAPYFRPSDDAA